MSKPKYQFTKIPHLCLIFTCLLFLTLIFCFLRRPSNQVAPLDPSPNLTIVPTWRDRLAANSSWCGTFQLVWNDLKNEVAHQDIIFTPQEPMAANLNQEEFKTDLLSDDYYYKIHGPMSLALKQQIETGIYDKFQQTSDILDEFTWSAVPADNEYFLYAMLYRQFNYLQKLDSLENDDFGDQSHGIAYFGETRTGDYRTKEQFEVLFYHSPADFAILINTDTNDEIIFYKNPQGNNFNDIYEAINQQAAQYAGNLRLTAVDEFKAPKLNVQAKREYSEITDRLFPITHPQYSSAKIKKALQTINFSLNESGGEIKSEAFALMMPNALADATPPPKPQPRYFYVDDTFALFFREKGQSLPYFAARIEDVTQFQ